MLPAALFRCGGVRLAVVPKSLLVRSQLSTNSRQSSEAKTAIQKWGWDYLLKQESLKRPLSPHLTVYKPMLTWMLSGATRISGVVMVGVLFTGGVSMMVLPWDFPTIIEAVRGWNIPAPITAALRFLIAFPLILHATNAMRHIGFHFAKGMDTIGTIYKTGWTAVAIALAITLVVVFWRGPQTSSRDRK